MPTMITNTAKLLPAIVLGYMSPYPTVVIVTTLQYMALNK